MFSFSLGRAKSSLGVFSTGESENLTLSVESNVPPQDLPATPPEHVEGEVLAENLSDDDVKERPADQVSTAGSPQDERDIMFDEEHEEEPPQEPLDITTEPPLTPMVLSPHRDSSHTPPSPIRPRDFSPLPEDVQTPMVIDLPVSAVRDEPMVVDSRPTATPDRTIGIKLEQVAYVLIDRQTSPSETEIGNDVEPDMGTTSQLDAEINGKLHADTEVHTAEVDTQVHPKVDEAHEAEIDEVHEPQIDDVPEPEVHEVPEPEINEGSELEIRRVGDLEVDEVHTHLPHVDARVPEVDTEPQEVATQVHVDTQTLPDEEEVHSELIQDHVGDDGQIHAEVDAHDISDVALGDQAGIDAPIEPEAHMEMQPPSSDISAAALGDQVDINISIEPEANMEVQTSPVAGITVQIEASAPQTAPSIQLGDDDMSMANIDASTDDIHPPEAVLESQSEDVNVEPESTPQTIISCLARKKRFRSALNRREIKQTLKWGCCSSRSSRSS